MIENAERAIERLRAWVESADDRGSQLYLRRLRVLRYVEEPDFAEALRELEAFET